MEDVKYFLVLENRPGDFGLIDVSKLDICHEIVTTELGSIDSFTSMHSIEEIKESIIRSNIVRPEYINGTLKIVSDKHHRLDILSKESFDLIIEFQKSATEIEREFKDKLYGHFKKIVDTFDEIDYVEKELTRFRVALSSNNKEDIFKIIGKLPYFKSRSIYLMIADEIIKRKQESLRKLEKTSENE